MNEVNDGYITTRAGQRFHFDTPEQFVYSLDDIGFCLGKLCRFAGQGDGWFSVAQHSLFVCSLLEPRDKLRGLLHDASEAYLVDVPGPLKRLPQMAGYREIEARVMATIHKQFGLLVDEKADARVKRADLIALKAEAKLLGLKGVNPEVQDYPDAEIPREILELSNGQAGKMFMTEAERLIGEL